MSYREDVKKGNVVELKCATTHDIPVERILNCDDVQDLKQVVIIGWDQDDGFYFASSMSDAVEVNWLLDTAKHHLFHKALGCMEED